MYYNSSFEYNECVAKGACSISPNISSMQEVMYILFRQTAFYLLKLIDFDIRKQDIIKNIIKEIAVIDSARDFSESQILDSFSKQYVNLVVCRKEYLKICKENNVKCEDLKNLVKFSPNTSLSEILKKGDKEFLSKYKKLNFEKKYIAEILRSIIKSVCSNLVSLYELGKISEIPENKVLKAINLFNSNRILFDTMKQYIDDLAREDINLLKSINELRTQKYGVCKKTEVSFSTRPNKAIMVSGSNFEDLALLLQFAEDKDIDIYTNGNLLISHAFPYFNDFKNLKGHFGSGSFNSILDFATFPGAILLTKNEAQNIEYLYRGRLFTTDDIAAKGVIKINDNDFLPLVNSALQAKGFAKAHDRASVDVGYDEAELDLVLDKIISENPERIFIIGHSNLSMSQKDYFKSFFNNLPSNSWVISFSYNPLNIDNVYSLNVANDYPMIYGILHKIFKKIPVTSEKLVFFLNKCDVNSLSNIINLKNSGAKHIYLSECPPTVINPAVLRAFNKIYGINAITNPSDDFKKIKEEL